MKPKPYSESQLPRFMEKMGDAFDYAINDCKIDGSEFVKMFAVSTACKKIENGEANYLSGKSGIEIAIECIYETTGKELAVEPSEKFNRSVQYWCGWAVCYYQWLSSRRYADIFKAVSFEDMLGLYPTLHEASVEKIASVIDEKVKTIIENNIKSVDIIKAAGLQESYKTEISKGVKLSNYVELQKDVKLP